MIVICGSHMALHLGFWKSILTLGFLSYTTVSCPLSCDYMQFLEYNEMRLMENEINVNFHLLVWPRLMQDDCVG